MINQKIISSLISIAVSALFIALFIILLPSILTILGVLILLIIIAVLVIRFMIHRQKIKMNFVFNNPNNYTKSSSRQDEYEEIHEMKDVTNSSKSHEK